MTILLLLGLGCFTGFAAGYLGIGGGIILVPVISEIFLAQGLSKDVAMTSAFATSLSTAVFTTGVSAWKQWRQDNLIPRAIPWTAGGAIFGGQIGALLGSRLSGGVLMIMFGLFLLFAAINLGMQKDSTGKTDNERFTRFGLVILGFITGIMGALFGVGGGILMVPAFIMLFHFPAGKVAGTSSAVACLIAISGVVGYLLFGSARATGDPGSLGVIDLTIAVPVIAGSVLTARYGALLNKRFGGGVYARVFAVFLVIIAVRMLLRGA